MAIDINGLRQDLQTYGDEIYVDYNENNINCFMVVMENCTARLDQQSEIDNICDNYILQYLPRSIQSTFVNGTYKKGFQL